MWQALIKWLPFYVYLKNPIVIVGRLHKTISAFFNNKCIEKNAWTDTWRHDSVLNRLLQQFFKIQKTPIKIYCNSSKFQCRTTLQLFKTATWYCNFRRRWNACNRVNNKYFETNTSNSRDYKIKPYKELKSQLLQLVSKFKVLFLEIIY